MLTDRRATVQLIGEKWYTSIYCARKIAHGVWIYFSIFLHSLAKSTLSNNFLDIYKLISILYKLRKNNLNHLHQLCKVTKLNISPVDNHCEIWRWHDTETRVVGEIYEITMEFIDIVSLVRLCKKKMEFIQNLAQHFVRNKYTFFVWAEL
jgi:hypothetical protein